MTAEIVPAEFCATYWATYEVPSSGPADIVYIVTLSGGEGPAHCTCPAFKFSKDRNCKHIEKVWAEACLWNPQWHDGGPATMKPTSIYGRTVQDGECPKCGGPTVPVRIAV